jgi:protein ImuB
VQRLAGVQDHRPERASRAQRAEAGVRPPRAGRGRRGSARSDDGAAAPGAPSSSRPVWLQEVAEPLAELRSRPLLDGRPLSLLSGPERIEAGWWDEGLAERDYFIAEAADGALVWIYRARLPLSAAGESGSGSGSGWFLHGRFG